MHIKIKGICFCMLPESHSEGQKTETKLKIRIFVVIQML